MSSAPRIIVVGLGYVGLPLAVALARKFPTVGFDIDTSRVEALRGGRDETNELSSEQLAASELKPNILTDYLFELANKFSTFFEECPVLKAESPERRDSRLALGDLTARTLKFGLDLLGIEVVDRM